MSKQQKLNNINWVYYNNHSSMINLCKPIIPYNYYYISYHSLGSNPHMEKSYSFIWQIIQRPAQWERNNHNIMWLKNKRRNPARYPLTFWVFAETNVSKFPNVTKTAITGVFCPNMYIYNTNTILCSYKYYTILCKDKSGSNK